MFCNTVFFIKVFISICTFFVNNKNITNKYLRIVMMKVHNVFIPIRGVDRYFFSGLNQLFLNNLIRLHN